MRCPNLRLTSWVHVLAFVLPSANRDDSLSVAISPQADHIEKFWKMISLISETN